LLRSGKVSTETGGKVSTETGGKVSTETGGKVSTEKGGKVSTEIYTYIQILTVFIFQICQAAVTLSETIGRMSNTEYRTPNIEMGAAPGIRA